jgi:protein-disulfide isomerase
MTALARLSRRLLSVAAFALLASPLAALPAHAQQSTGAQQSAPDGDSPFSTQEQDAIDRQVREYILENPEIIMQAVQILRERQEQQAENARREGVRQYAEALRDSGPLPVLGNPDGDVTIVEFFDYRCPYCRQVANLAVETAKADGNVRVVYKEYPILGPESEFAARAAIAAAMQGRYAEFHKALMNDVQTVNQDSVMRLAEMMDLDVEQLKTDMRSDKVTETIQRTRQLGQQLQINGTPAFIVGTEVAPGAISRDQLEEMIAQARQEG